MNQHPIVIYSKCKPQNADVWEIAERHKVVFFGYPAWRNNCLALLSEDKLSGYSKALFNVFEQPECANQMNESSGYRRAVTGNANIVKEVKPGSYVIVPRLNEGVCKIGKITGPFTVEDRPLWGPEYISLRKAKKLDISEIAYHIGDVSQIWHVESWETVLFPLIPRWISYRLLSRNTFGRIYDIANIGLFAHQRLSQVISNPVQKKIRVNDSEEIEKQLLEIVSPHSLEHLIVDLLQLEHGNSVRWHHVGGSGDCGVDGIGISLDGKVSGVVQCKWFCDNGKWMASILSELASIRQKWPDCKIIGANLLGLDKPIDNLSPGVEFIGRRKIATLIQKHWKVLPLSATLGIFE